MVACIFGVILNTSVPIKEWVDLSLMDAVLCSVSSPPLLSGYDLGVKKKRRNSSGTGQEIQRYFYHTVAASRFGSPGPRHLSRKTRVHHLQGLSGKGCFGEDARPSEAKC